MEPAAQFGISRWERLRTIDPRIRDGLLGIAAFALTVIGAHHDPAAPDPDAVALTLIALGTLPLVLHRRAPVAVLAVIGAAGAAYALRDGSANLEIPLAIAAFSAAARRDRRTVITLALPIAVAASAVMAVADDTAGNWVEVLLALVPVPGVPMLLGRVSFNRRRRIDRDHVLAAREAVATERSRIARELHDVVAHSMSVMVVQAGAARSVLARDPEQAEAAIERIEETGRSGLSEMRRLLEILKADGDETGLEPQPGLDDLDGLVERVRGAGLPVEVMVRGEPRPLPLGVDLTAYRLVQEALTNTLKHAGRAHAGVTIGYTDNALELEVVDDGRGPLRGDGPNDAYGSAAGHGLVGMRERVTLFGGTLQTGARPGGGYRITASIPAARVDGTTP
jgi:signal transduction histidine kinase